RHTGDAFMKAVVERAHESSVPTVIHLDHGADLDQMIWAVRTGFTSVMLDGSMLRFDENVDLTRKACEIAHAVGLSVEGELGTIGSTDTEAEYGSATIIYTVPEDAVRFVEETGVDSLAIAIGTSHGIYPTSMKPELKLDLLGEIAAAVSVPLVLHGGSNNPDDEIGQAARSGINKINISSDIKVAYHDEMRRVLADAAVREPNTIQPPSVAAMKRTAEHKIRLFGSDHKAALYGA
ncbi:MAG: class II fructose-bisphosphate aldolase, partial [Propioniciclava sp.]